MSDFSLTRRHALRTIAGLGAATLGAGACSRPDDPPSPTPLASAGSRRMGAEWDRHARTLMSWPTATIWYEDVSVVRRDIAGLARAVAEYEAVVLLARPEDVDDASRACGSGVEVVPIPVDDLWARDTAPVFVSDGGVDFNFNGWGSKQPHANDAGVARAVLAKYGLPRVQTTLVAEGGALETDGQGTLLVTESSLVNKNRNPGLTRQQIEDELKRVLGVTKVIWFVGVRNKDITDAHVDCLARFVAPGVVLLDQAAAGSPPDIWSRAADQARTVLAESTDATGKPLQVIDLPQPDPDRVTVRGSKSVISYANFYVGNGAVFLPKFGDAEADDRAGQILREHLPGREIVPVRIDAIAAGGGGIHCATHDQPAG
ncbi:agmatine deiminase family protein [Kutzneria sp. CA-103260]|uniref:agmatine deiminase family protein n=1 Tax=Kutzneria sp. CA-103260 TaxID=2802641 RepID=UPI001BAC3AE9|nr:agmatine deiminase family protein [Kutzneria sp. CA-103260]QUQ64713.1 agmatine deiminase family protein [Kutzneria sp. CA-103260]